MEDVKKSLNTSRRIGGTTKNFAYGNATRKSKNEFTDESRKSKNGFADNSRIFKR